MKERNGRYDEKEDKIVRQVSNKFKTIHKPRKPERFNMVAKQQSIHAKKFNLIGLSTVA